MKRGRIATGLTAGLAAVSSLLAPSAAMGSRVAVYLANQASESHAPFVRELSQVLATSLMEEPRLTVMEGTRAEETVGMLTFDPGDPGATEEALEWGRSLNASAVVADSFSEVYRIEAELIETKTGEVVAGLAPQGRRGDVFDLVDVLGRELTGKLRATGKTKTRVAVLYFENLGPEDYRQFVRGLSDMLMTSLQQSPGLSIIDRAHVDEGVAHFGLEPGTDISAERASEMGTWLGAELVVAGRFTETYEIAVRSVDVGKGTVMGPDRKIVGQRGELSRMVRDLGGELLRGFSVFYESISKIAVLYFQNHTSDRYDRFVRGLSDMLMTSLGQAEDLMVIERVQIDKAMENLRLEMSGPIDAETAVEVGKWVGADAVVLGSFTEFGGDFRIDARLIEAATGELLVAQNVRGPESDVISMIDQLGAKLIASFNEKEAAVKGGTGYLRVRFMMTRAEMTERPVYFHIAKLYIDGKSKGVSPVMRELEKWESLFSAELRAGKHEVEVVHGYVSEDGQWDGEYPKQPRVFRVTVSPGSTTTIQYSFAIGWFGEGFYYGPPWRGGGK